MQVFLIRSKKKGVKYAVFDKFIKDNELYYMIVSKRGNIRHIEAKVLSTYYHFVDSITSMSDFIELKSDTENYLDEKDEDGNDE